jgi:putative radical SAM enzyme (TIGR03279 family)
MLPSKWYGASPPSDMPSGKGLAVESAEGPAATAGLQAGDLIVAVDGEAPEDVLDLELAAADGHFLLGVRRDEQSTDMELTLRPGEHHGIGLAGGIGVPLRRCANDCAFCFIDQLPVGLRRSLYVKDDDYRLSFLAGGFVTLSNLRDADLARIERLRLSPLYVSLHAWDDERRVALMGKKAAVSRQRLLQLVAAGIRLHIQVVLCPGWNDGEVLDDTVRALAAFEGIEDVGVVPVSVAAGHRLRPLGAAAAIEALPRIEALQDECRSRRGEPFVHAADELYLLAGRTPPPCEAACQYENGIGIAAVLLGEASELASDASLNTPARPPVALLTGTLAAPVVQAVCDAIGRARPFVVGNRLFGDHVTVTGLLGGVEVLEKLAREPLADGEWLLVPAAFLPPDLGVTLDDVTETAVSAACEGRLLVGEGLADAFARLPS